MSIDWSKAPEGATHVYIKEEGSPVHSHWIKIDGDARYFIAPLEREDRKWMKDRHPADLDKCISIPPESWNGEGLPPVGSKVEFFNNSEWVAVEVLFLTEITILIRLTDEFGHQECALSPDYCKFRPIRTPEQIAADEREHSIRNACTAISHTLDQFRNDIACANAARAVVEALHDAGYRKQPPTP